MRKIINKTLAFIMTGVLALGSMILSVVNPDLAEYIWHSIIYSGVSIIRYIPLVVLSIAVLIYFVMKMMARDIQLIDRVRSIIWVFILVSFSIFSGMFYKAPFYSTSMFTKDYYGPVREINYLGALEFKIENCSQYGKEVLCEFLISNNSNEELFFKVNQRSLIIDYSETNIFLWHYYVGEEKYSIHDNDRFIVPSLSHRGLKLLFETELKEKMKVLPYLKLKVSGKNSSDDMEYRNVPIKNLG